VGGWVEMRVGGEWERRTPNIDETLMAHDVRGLSINHVKVCPNLLRM